MAILRNVLWGLLKSDTSDGSNGLFKLRESEIKDPGPMLPARVVLEYDEAEGIYWTYLESYISSGETKVHYRRDFSSEAEALEDFQTRVARL